MDNQSLSKSEVYSLMFDLSKSGINLDHEIRLMGQSDDIPSEVSHKLDKILTQQLNFITLIKSKWIYKSLKLYVKEPARVSDGILIKCMSSILTHLSIDFENENFVMQTFNASVPLHELTDIIYASLMKVDNYEVMLHSEVTKVLDYLDNNG